MNKLFFLAIIPVLMLTVPNVNASDINCKEIPDHKYCSGGKGVSGMVFCDQSCSLDGREIENP